MLRATLVLAAAALAGLVSAQNYSTSGAISVVPDSVMLDLREQWCTAQMNTCPQICGGRAFPNTCSVETLTYDCKCTGKQTPNISAYEQTLPYFICQQWVIDCVDAHPNDLAGITGCRSLVCGQKNASTLVSSSSAPTQMTTMQSSKPASTAPAKTTSKPSKPSKPSAASTTTSSAAAAATAMVLALGNNYGTGLLAAGMLGAFGLAL